MHYNFVLYHDKKQENVRFSLGNCRTQGGPIAPVDLGRISIKLGNVRGGEFLWMPAIGGITCRKPASVVILTNAHGHQPKHPRSAQPPGSAAFHGGASFVTVGRVLVHATTNTPPWKAALPYWMMARREMHGHAGARLETGYSFNRVLTTISP
jgi:hypothetical protein